MSYWTFGVGGLALALVPLVHMLLLGRGFAVSGRYSALVDRLRFGRPAEPAPELDTAALLAMIRAQTGDAFGADALEPADATEPEPVPPAPTVPESHASHLVFFAGVLLGGLASSLAAARFGVSLSVHSAGLARLAALTHVPAPLLLSVGGLLVGFGTRMAAGCTSGHGLCGVSQRQLGSLLATAAFFGAAVLASFAFEVLW